MAGPAEEPVLFQTAIIKQPDVLENIRGHSVVDTLMLMIVLVVGEYANGLRSHNNMVLLLTTQHSSVGQKTHSMSC